MTKIVEITRDARIDFVKGVCILLMVWGHLPRLGACHEGLERVVFWIYTFHMPVFVLISGYLFGSKTTEILNVRRVFVRMFKPYFTMSIVTIVLYWAARKFGLATSVDVHVESLLDVINRILHGRGGGALWYLYMVGVMELLVLASLWICQRTRLLSSSVWAVICVVIGVVTNLLQKAGFCIPVQYLPYFLIGYFVRRAGRELMSSWLFVLAIPFLVQMIDGEISSVVNCLWVMSILGVMMAFAKSMAENGVCRWISYLGRHTLSVLIFHNIVSVGMRPISPYILAYENTGIALNIVLLFCVVSACISVEIILRKLGIDRIFW